MKKILLLIIIFFCLPVYAKVKVHFTPSLECENSIVGLINNSKKTIDIAVYSINNNQIVEALKKAHGRGIKLRILTDKLQASSKHSKVFDLYEYGINIRVNSKHKIEHNNPYGEKDFGAFEFKGKKIFWKIDYYDRELLYISPDACNPKLTNRVLTIMYADEY